MGLIPRFIRSSHPSKPDNSLLYMMAGGQTSYTGKRVSEDEALGISAVWAGVKGISEIIGSLPLFLFKRIDKGKEKAVTHNLFNLMHLKPNPFMSSMTLREVLAGQALLYGTAYAEKAYNRNREVAELWPLNAANMTVKALGSELIYAYILPNGQTKILADKNVLRIPGFSANGITGFSPVKIGKQALGLAMALEEFGARFFGNGGHPNVVFEHPEELSQEAHDRLRKAWEERHVGLENAHRVAILEGGLKLHEFGVSPEDAQALESRKFQLAEVARIFNMPMHMLKEMDRATFNNIEVMSLEFVTYCLAPWLTRFEQSYSTQLLNDVEINDYFFEHSLDGLLRGNTEARHRAYQIGRQWGYFSANDVRNFENMNPIDGGDSYLVPLNMVDAKSMSKLTPDEQNAKRLFKYHVRNLNAGLPKARMRLREVYRNIFYDAVNRLISLETNRVSIELNRTTQRDLTDFQLFLTNYYNDFPVIIQRNLGPIFLAFAEQIFEAAKEEIGFDDGSFDDLREWVDRFISGYGKRHVDESLGQIRGLIQENAEDFFDAVQQRLDDWREDRANKITDRQLLSMSNGTAAQVFFMAGMTAVWRTVADSCPYCVALNGKAIRKHESFIHADDEFKPEGADSPLNLKRTVRYPPIHSGCDCIIVNG